MKAITISRLGKVVQGSCMTGLADALGVHRNAVVRLVNRAEREGGVYWTRKYEVFVTDRFIKGKRRGSVKPKGIII
jgi:hypothetical protein